MFRVLVPIPFSSVLADRSIWPIHNDEFEDKVAMSWDFFDTEVFNLRCSVLSQHFVGPQIPNLNELVSFGHNSEVLDSELIIVVSMLSPIDDQGDCVTSCHFCGINLGFPEEDVPVRATEETGCLGGVRVLVNADKLLVLQDIDRALRSD